MAHWLIIPLMSYCMARNTNHPLTIKQGWDKRDIDYIIRSDRLISALVLAHEEGHLTPWIEQFLSSIFDSIFEAKSVPLLIKTVTYQLFTRNDQACDTPWMVGQSHRSNRFATFLWAVQNTNHPDWRASGWQVFVICHVSESSSFVRWNNIN